MESLKGTRLNRLDAAQLQRGYYENLLDAARFNEELFEHYSERPKDWIPVKQTEAAYRTGDIQEFVLIPSADIMFKGARFTTDRWSPDLMTEPSCDSRAHPRAARRSCLVKE